MKVKMYENLDHVDGLDDTGGKHTRGTSIDKRLNLWPDTSSLGLLLLCHFFDSKQ